MPPDRSTHRHTDEIIIMPSHPMGPEMKSASTYLLSVYTKYLRQRSMLNDFMKMVSKMQSKANSTGLTPSWSNKYV